jgi:hypothetical protein
VYDSDRLCEERALRTLLAEYENKLDRTAVYIMNRLADCMFAQGKYAETETLVENNLLRAREIGCLHPVQADFLRTLAKTQYELYKDDLAEQNIRNAIELYAENFGLELIRTCGTLERWLHGWCRDEEADELRKRIDEIIRPDDIDMELNVYL